MISTVEAIKLVASTHLALSSDTVFSVTASGKLITIPQLDVLYSIVAPLDLQVT